MNHAALEVALAVPRDPNATMELADALHKSHLDFMLYHGELDGPQADDVLTAFGKLRTALDALDTVVTA